jgi:SAM-dependent methyltransferase
MARHVRLGELLLGVEGLALVRNLFTEAGSPKARIEEIRRIACGDDEVYELGVDVPNVDFKSGYAKWSETYDQPGNPLISIEQPAVWDLLDALPVGDALDAACGTGRHTRRLVELGHRVVGVDGSAEMLAKARTNTPGADLRDGDLSALPLDDATVDVAVCALALEHVESLEQAVSELARVARPGATVVISDLHPVMTALGGAAYFQDATGGAAVVRGYKHVHGDYLRAFDRAGLVLRQCLEPRLTDVEAGLQGGPASTFIPEAAIEAYAGLPGAVVWELRKPS